MLRAIRAKRRLRLRGQSLVEFALVTPLLLLLLAGGTDVARAFFIGVDVTNSLREGALYAGQHGNDIGQDSGTLDTQIRTIFDNEEQGSYVPFHCPSWSHPPTAAQVSIVEPSGTIPATAGQTTTVVITATCDVTPLLTFLPWSYHLHTSVQSLVVGQVPGQ
jgi:Flp pilus assembly protein TadG